MRNVNILVSSLASLLISARAQAGATAVAGRLTGSCSATITAAATGVASTAAGWRALIGGSCCVPPAGCTWNAAAPPGMAAGSTASGWWTIVPRASGTAVTVFGGDTGGNVKATGGSPACEGTVQGNFTLTWGGSQWQLQGNWSSTHAGGNADVCVTCGGVQLYCANRSGTWNESLSSSGELCPPNPGPGQTVEEWYDDNMVVQSSSHADGCPLPEDGGVAQEIARQPSQAGSGGCSASGGGAPGGIVLLLLVLVVATRFGRRRR